MKCTKICALVVMASVSFFGSTSADNLTMGTFNREGTGMKKKSIAGIVMFFLLVFFTVIPWRVQAESSADIYATNLLQSAHLSYMMKDYDKTIKLCNKVLSIKGISGRVEGKAYRYIGESFVWMKRNLPAMAFFDKIIKMPDAAPEDKEAARQFMEILGVLVPK